MTDPKLVEALTRAADEIERLRADVQKMQTSEGLEGGEGWRPRVTPEMVEAAMRRLFAAAWKDGPGVSLGIRQPPAMWRLEIRGALEAALAALPVPVLREEETR